MTEALILAIQRAIATELDHLRTPDGELRLPAPEVATALLSVLASMLETSPGCRTPSDLRKTGEAAGRELGLLMRDARRLSQGDALPPGRA